MTQEQEINVVKNLGETIGYGHLMSLASALWRKSLKDKGYPEHGAFVPTCIDFINKEMVEMTEDSSKMYDNIIKS
jgi:hypothetical protein